MKNTKEFFDGWASTYNQTVKHAYLKFPFAGYEDVNKIVLSSIQRKKAKILDIGIGTGMLAEKIIATVDSPTLMGIDISEKMLEIARKKIPNANLSIHDFKQTIILPKGFTNFDYIISNYTFHHFTEKEKKERILYLLTLLKKGGKLIISDIGFWDHKEFTLMKTALKKDWDNDEYYFKIRNTIDFIHKLNMKLTIHKVSFCAWILSIERI
jgi:putative AdoMet-dependent methyltransferase